MFINEQLVSYKFGPRYDMDICFSETLEASMGGLSYDRIGSGGKLYLQLLCHAVHQLQNSSGRGWTLEKIEEAENWVYDAETGGYTLKKSEMICARYQIKAEGRLVFAVREGVNCDYVVEYLDPVDDRWMDAVLEEADEHCRHFGRIG